MTDSGLAQARRFAVATVTVFLLAAPALVRSQSTSPSASQPQDSPPQQQPPIQASAKPQPKRVPAPTVADVARVDKSKADASAPEKVYTDDDVKALPPGDISLVGPDPSQNPVKPKPKLVDDTAQKAAYWKARFTAARQKLAADKRTLPALQTQLETERVQETIGDPDTGQLYSDTHMSLLHQIDALKVTIQNDQKALRALHDEFSQAGGLPSWIQ